MDTRVRGLFGALLANTCTLAHGVSLDPHGLGQVLVYPYYTANSNHATLLSITNATGRGEALKVRFDEGFDGRGVLDFNVYLAPHATWVGEVANWHGSADGAASLITRDNACTVPAFAPLPGDPALRFLDFSSASYAGSVTATGPTGNADGGPRGLARTREGHFDVLEMGEITDASHGSLTAITPVNGVPADCAAIVAAWAGDGYWVADPTADLAAPGGGIFGSAAIIDVEQGTLYAAQPEAITGFSTAIQHTAPGSATPDLHSASRSENGRVTASVPVAGAMLALEYDNPIDAISALFMVDSLYNEFTTNPSLGALSDWIVTAPTKRYYVDPAYIGSSIGASARPPFEAGFLQGLVSGSANGASGGFSSFPYACVQVGAWAYERSGSGSPVTVRTPGGLQPGAQLTPCLETSVLTFSTQTETVNGSSMSLPLSALGSALGNGADPYFMVFNGGLTPNSPPVIEGTLRLDLVHDTDGNPLPRHRLPPASNGVVLIGLPLFGFVAETYINGNVIPGVLANYSGTYRHRGSVACATATGSPQACP